jgi:multicomponent Na+:H+ antiporter subunit A
MVTFTLVHALYKGGLFMMAGSIDHETGTRNVLKLGGLRSLMPYTLVGALLTALSMSGIPPLFGFIGKEVVYEAALRSESWSLLILAAGVLANAALVASGLVVGLKPFFGTLNEDDLPKAHVHEAPVSMWLGPAVLGALGLAIGVYPALVDHSLLQAAHVGILQQPYDMHLALWHGFNAALMASLVTFALGGTLYVYWESLQDSAFFRGLARAFGSGPGAVFERGLYGTARLSHGATRFFQTGSFRWYLLAIFSSIFVLVGGSLAAEATLQWPDTLGTVRYYEAALAGLIVLAALVAVAVRDRFVAILALSVGGYGVALLYLLFGAPDLALTQFSIETLSLILLVIVLIHLPGIQGREPLSLRVRDAIVATGCGVLMTVIMMAVLAMPMNMELSNYLTAKSYTEAFGKNIVNVILVDFRGIDTMGEITVLTIAALGVYVLMRMPRMRREASNGTPPSESAEAEPPAVQEAA